MATIEIAKVIFQNLTDPILIYDFADYFYTNVTPKSYFCILEDTEKAENEFLQLLKKYPNYKIEKGVFYTIKVNMEGQWVNFELTNKMPKSRNIIEKSNFKIKKLCKIYICACYGCKNQALFKQDCCLHHTY